MLVRALTLGLLLVATPGGDALELPSGVRELLRSGHFQGTAGAFRLIALSEIADGCAGQARARPERREAARGCVARTLALARRELPDPSATGDGLRLTHLALVLGAGDAVGACPDPALHRRLAERLARLSLEDPHGHAPSFAGSPLRWPADQAATLASLGRYDRAHGADLAAEPLGRWKAALAGAMDAPRGLPRSEVTGGGPGARYARGCAQSYLGRYLPEVDPALAASWWDRYRRQYLVRRGPIPGFLEWPPGVDGGADQDSGPLVLGVGAAASAFGIAAARAHGDALLAAELETGADLVLGAGVGGAAARTTLADAIRFQARWQPVLGGGGRAP